jgi:hypothetical protein
LHNDSDVVISVKFDGLDPDKVISRATFPPLTSEQRKLASEKLHELAESLCE